MAGWRAVGGGLLAAGLLGILSGVMAFFPGGSFSPWFISWDARIAAPLWTGILATVAGSSVVMANRDQNRKFLWELAYTFSLLCALTSPLMFAVAMAAALMGPLCYYSYLGAVGTGYLSDAVRHPFPYRAGPGLCLEPPAAEWFHLGLRLVDLLTSTALFLLSLGVVAALTSRLLRAGHVNTRV